MIRVIPRWTEKPQNLESMWQSFIVIMYMCIFLLCFLRQFQSKNDYGTSTPPILNFTSIDRLLIHGHKLWEAEGKHFAYLWSLNRSTKSRTSCQRWLVYYMSSWRWTSWLLHRTQLLNCSKRWRLMPVFLKSWSCNKVYSDTLSHRFLLHVL